MKRLLYTVVFSLAAVSCSVKLPESFYKKQLPERDYVENTKNKYILHFDKSHEAAYLKQPEELVSPQFNDSIAVVRKQATRPYFAIISGTDTALVANRHIYFKDVVNFRDIGGLKTVDGKTVKWGRIYRSDNLSKLRTGEFEKFNDLGIQTVYDLRTDNEIKGKEDHLPAGTAYIHFSTVEDNEDLLNKMRKRVIDGEITEERSLQLMLNLYRGTVSDNIPLLRQLLQQIINANEPVLYHCSAGKDRTGIVTALLLSILKVDRQTITNEYMLSNYYRREKLQKIVSKAKLAKIVKPHLAIKAIQNFMGVDERYLNAAFDVIDTKYRGMDKFIQNQLGINAAEQERIIKKFTY